MECHQKEVMASYSFGRFCRHFSENASKRKTFYFNLSHGCQTVEMKWFCGGNLEELHTDLFFLLLLWVLQRASTYSEICVVLQCLPDVWEEHVPLPRKENEATEFCLGWRFPDNHKALCYGSPGDVEGRWHCNHHLLCLFICPSVGVVFFFCCRTSSPDKGKCCARCTVSVALYYQTTWQLLTKFWIQ